MTGSVRAENDWSIFDENAWLGIRGLLAVAVCGLVARLLLQVGRPRFRRRRLSAFELAYLAGGPERVALTALVGLRAQGAITVSGQQGWTTLHLAAPPVYADPVELAVHHAMSYGVEPARLPTAPAVAAATGHHMEQLRRDGLLLTPRRRRAARIAGVIGGMGAVLVGTLIFFVGLALLFTPVRERPFIARHVLARYRKRHRIGTRWPHHAPTARMTVAIHGDAAVLDGDPDLACALDIRHTGPASTRRGGHAAGDGSTESDGDGGGD